MQPITGRRGRAKFLDLLNSGASSVTMSTSGNSGPRNCAVKLSGHFTKRSGESRPCTRLRFIPIMTYETGRAQLRKKEARDGRVEIKLENQTVTRPIKTL